MKLKYVITLMYFIGSNKYISQIGNLIAGKSQTMAPEEMISSNSSI